MLNRDNFKNLLDHWFSRQVPDNVLADIYDGQVWKTFKDIDDSKFFIANTLDGRLGFCLNIDWFRTIKHTIYSVGAIYLTILNLLHHLHYKKENIIFAGLISGPNEPSADKINIFLKPLVNELNQLWKGQLF